MPEFDVGLSYLEDVPDDLILDLVGPMRSAGAVVRTEARERDVVAGMEWLIPTAIGLFITQKYFGTLISEAAKDHYPIFKRALLRTLRRTSRPEGDVVQTWMSTSPGKLGPSQPGLLSVQLLSDRGTLRFVFPETLDREAQERSMSGMFEMLEEYERKGASAALCVAIAQQMERGAKEWEMVIRISEENGTWYVWSRFGNQELGKPVPPRSAS